MGMAGRGIFFCEGHGAMVVGERLPLFIRKRFVWAVIEAAVVVLHYSV